MEQIISNAKILTIIPAKRHSIEIPEKNFIPFAGQSLLYWTLCQAFKSHYIMVGNKYKNKIVVITEDIDREDLPFRNYQEGKLRYIKNWCAGSIESTILELHKNCQIELTEWDYILLLQPTSPLRLPTDIDSVIAAAAVGNFISVFSVCNTRDQCYWSFWNHNSKLMPSYQYNNRRTRIEYRNQDKLLLHENGSIYFFQPKLLMDNKRISDERRTPYIMEDWQDYEVDSKEDFDICEMLFREKLKRSYLVL